MIYWFTGLDGSGKTTQATKLKEFLQTEKRNWRKDVFHIDEKELIDIFEDTINIQKNAQNISYFLNQKGCDVVVSMISSNKKIREEFKNKCADSIVEIYVHSNRKKIKEQNKFSEYQIPEKDFFYLDTTIDNPTQSFTKLIHYLKDFQKI